MKWPAVVAGVLSCALVSAAALSAQLGDVARKEAERRKTVKSSGKTYTNDTLTSAPQPSSAPASSGAPSSDAPAAPPPPPSSSSSATPPAARVSSDPAARKKEEGQWRDKIKGEREALERAKTFADALQTKINALNTDFVNRDDPAQRSVIAADREKALAEMARLKKEIADHTKAIAGIQEEARKAGVPAGWVR
jgi:hypothetical protein